MSIWIFNFLYSISSLISIFAGFPMVLLWNFIEIPLVFLWNLNCHFIEITTEFRWISSNFSLKFLLNFNCIFNEFPLVFHWKFNLISNGYPFGFHWNFILFLIEISTGFELDFRRCFIEISKDIHWNDNWISIGIYCFFLLNFKCSFEFHLNYQFPISNLWILLMTKMPRRAQSRFLRELANDKYAGYWV